MEYIGGGVDYNSGPYTVQFDVGVTRVSFDVMIKNDNIFEDNETFHFNIESSSLPTGVAIGNYGQSIVTILENDSK